MKDEDIDKDKVIAFLKRISQQIDCFAGDINTKTDISRMFCRTIQLLEASGPDSGDKRPNPVVEDVISNLLLVQGSLDSLGVALTDYNHVWSEGERAIYETSVDIISSLIKAEQYTATNMLVEDVISGLQKIADENTDKIGSPSRGWACRQAIQLLRNQEG